MFLFHEWEWKYSWWSLFSQVESMKFENYVRVNSFMDIFSEIYRNLYRVFISQKKRMGTRLKVLPTDQHHQKCMLDPVSTE